MLFPKVVCHDAEHSDCRACFLLMYILGKVPGLLALDDGVEVVFFASTFYAGKDILRR